MGQKWNLFLKRVKTALLYFADVIFEPYRVGDVSINDSRLNWKYQTSYKWLSHFMSRFTTRLNVLTVIFLRETACCNRAVTQARKVTPFCSRGVERYIEIREASTRSRGWRYKGYVLLFLFFCMGWESHSLRIQRSPGVTCNTMYPWTRSRRAASVTWIEEKHLQRSSNLSSKRVLRKWSYWATWSI